MNRRRPRDARTGPDLFGAGFVADAKAPARQEGLSKLVEITASYVHETDGAWFIDDGGQRVWVPKSMVERNADGTWTMPESLAKEKGLI